MSFSTYTTLKPQQALRKADASLNGLSSEEARKRFQLYGQNALAASEARWWEIWLRQFKSAFVYLLLAAALIAIGLSDFMEGFLILLFVIINSSLGFYQEYQSEHALQLLKQFIQAKSRVRRDGKELTVDSSELVPGDIILLKAGDRIPADVRFLSVQDLLVDESALTGESVPVNKTADATKLETEPYLAKNIGFSATTIIAGQAEAVIIATGNRTEMGDISRLAVETRRVGSFEKGLNRFSVFILRLILLTLIVVFLVNLAIKGEHANIPQLLIFSIALAVSVIPEALPIVATISLARGALKLAKNHVVVKRLSAIEDLGSVEILCTDKTGTITENKLTVVDVFGVDKSTTLHAAALACSLQAKELESVDPFDRAIWKALSEAERKHVRAASILAQVPFDPRRRRNSVLAESAGETRLILRGALETIYACCVHADDASKKNATAWAVKQGKLGRRVLAIAEKNWTGPSAYHAKNDENGAHLLGLIAFEDPIKPTAKHAVEQARALGLQVKILTGDSAEVATAVALEIGLIRSESEVMDGDTLEHLPIQKQEQAVEAHAVFARVSPEQKYRIIQLLEAKHEVGFLGEGINDAPALKVANIGLVVSSATDIARDAADIILLKSSLDVIVRGIREGREVFANTLKYIKGTLASNFGNFFAVAAASLLSNTLPMLPIQLLLVNLLTDFPMISISTDNVDPSELRRPQRYQVRDIALIAIILGVVSTIFDFIFFALYRSSPSAVLQTNWFIGSVLTELVFVYSIRTRKVFFLAKRPSSALIGLTFVAAGVALVLPFTPFGHRVFHFFSPAPTHIATILLVVLAYFFLSETVKLAFYRSMNGQK